MSKKAMIAMSGGVDSSVAAFLMIQEGYECSGVTMKLHDNTNTEKSEATACLASSETEDARLVAESLGIPFSVCHMEDLFRKYVIDPFVLSYLKGDTPNPCICCNRHLKFRALLNEALSQGMDFIASGHYAQSFFDPALNRWMLKKGADLSKDQSYVLYSLTQDQLSHTIFPLGG